MLIVYGIMADHGRDRSKEEGRDRERRMEGDKDWNTKKGDKEDLS